MIHESHTPTTVFNAQFATVYVMKMRHVLTAVSFFHLGLCHGYSEGANGASVLPSRLRRRKLSPFPTPSTPAVSQFSVSITSNLWTVVAPLAWFP